MATTNLQNKMAQLGLYPKHFQTLVYPKEEAIQNAQNEYSAPTTGQRVTFWTDGSRRLEGDNTTGAAVVHRRNHDRAMPRWAVWAYYFAKSTANSDTPELYSITQALYEAERHCETQHNPASSLDPQTSGKAVVIYSDCTNAFDMLKWERKINLDQLDLITTAHRHMRKLNDMGWVVYLIYVPAHKGIGGNEVADKNAQLATARPLKDHEIRNFHTVLHGVYCVDVSSTRPNWAGQKRKAEEGMNDEDAYRAPPALRCEDDNK